MNELSKLTIPIRQKDVDQLLHFWRWLVPAAFKPLEMTIFGSWFFVSPDQRVFFLDVLEGELHQVASSVADFESQKQQEANLRKWFMIDLANLCFASGLKITDGQCFALRVPIVMGGAATLDNIVPFDLLAYQTVIAQLHQKDKSSPGGYLATEIKLSK